MIAPITATKMIGHHHGSPSGPISVTEVSAARPASIARIGSSAASSVATPRRVGGAGAPQRRDPRDGPELRVEQAPDVAHARRPIQGTPRDRAARRLDRPMPRLGAREQRDDLERGGQRQHARRRARQRGGEVVAMAGEDESEQPGCNQRADDGDDPPVALKSSMNALPERAHAAGRGRADGAMALLVQHRSHSTRVGPPHPARLPAIPRIAERRAAAYPSGPSSLTLKRTVASGDAFNATKCVCRCATMPPLSRMSPLALDGRGGQRRELLASDAA